MSHPARRYSEQELHALATLQNLLGSIDKEGLIGKQLETLMSRLNSIIRHDSNSTDYEAPCRVAYGEAASNSISVVEAYPPYSI